MTNTRSSEAPESITNREPELLTPEARPRRLRIIGGIAGVAVVAAAAGGAAAYFLRGQSDQHPSDGRGPDTDDHQTVQTPDTAAPSAAASPEASTVPSSDPETARQTATEAIPAGLTPEQFGSTMTDRLTAWITGGATPELYDKWLNGGTSSEQIVADAANANSLAMANALFGEDWRGKKSLEDLYEKFSQYNLADLDQYVHTYNRDAMPQDTEPYRMSNSFNNAELVNDENGVRVIDVSATEHNNAAKNRVGIPGTSVYSEKELGFNNTEFTYRWTTKVVKTGSRTDELITGWQNISQSVQ